MIQIKRTYDPPAHGDGRRILVERLWPRGMRIGPQPHLRSWLIFLMKLIDMGF